jgi:hypothetical protein
MSSEVEAERELQQQEELQNNGEGGSVNQFDGGEGEAGPANNGGEIIKGPWSAAEDDLLHRLVEHFGARNWTLIGKFNPYF